MVATNFKIAILDDFEKVADTVPAYAKLKERADITLVRERLDSSEKIVARLRDFDALLLMRERTFFSDKEYGQLPKLKFIAQTGRTSVHLDLANATKRGIAISGTPSDSGSPTKELTVGLILALARKIPQVNQRMREERWPAIAGLRLEGKTIGVLGLGRIGNEVARIMKAFNTRVLGWSRSLTPERAAQVGAEAVPMQTLLKESDFVTVHVHFNAQTTGLIGEKEIASMKRGAFLVNTGRGPIIDEKAMLAALESGHLGGVGLDVYDHEPLPMDHPLRRCDNAILMSHRGYATVEMLSERYEQAITNLLAYLDGNPSSLINPDVQIRNAT
ncbi:MAG TPA: D-2-hydroxyacid dehydrogenase family protein [Candidatus Limnocylindria bacterium]|nr:D-2-hydroxyacid dehydrogenase family protein [Candidatus Limnocylindria bacterium]